VSTVEPIRHVPTLPFDPAVRTYTQFAGFYEPYEYTDWIDESVSWKETCYVGDWSGLVKLRVRGRDALRFFSDLAVNSFARFDVGQAKHAVFCNEAGKVMGEGILMRLGEDDFVFTSGPGAIWANFVASQGGYDMRVDVVTEQHTIQQVQGPNSLPLLEELAGESLRDIGFMRFRTVSIAGHEVRLLRQGMAGEVGYELHGAWDEGAEVVSAILAAGEKYGIRRLGGRTKMVNHVEACFPTPSVDYVPAWFDFAQTAELAEFVPETVWRRQQQRGGSYEGPLSGLNFSPVELGWGRNVKFDHDFRGADALRAEVEHPRRVMRTLVWKADDVAEVTASFFQRDETPYDFMEWPRGLLGRVEADRIRRDGADVGLATSRCYSYTFREMLSLAVIDVGAAADGTEVEVVWGRPGSRQKAIRAVVRPAPYKTDNRRLDVATI